MIKKYLNPLPFLFIFMVISVFPLFAEDKLAVGSKAPDFSLPVVGADKPIAMSDFVDKKIVIVHFWKSR